MRPKNAIGKITKINADHVFIRLNNGNNLRFKVTQSQAALLQKYDHDYHIGISYVVRKTGERLIVSFISVQNAIYRQSHQNKKTLAIAESLTLRNELKSKRSKVGNHMGKIGKNGGLIT